MLALENLSWLELTMAIRCVNKTLTTYVDWLNKRAQFIIKDQSITLLSTLAPPCKLSTAIFAKTCLAGYVQNFVRPFHRWWLVCLFTVSNSGQLVSQSYDGSQFHPELQWQLTSKPSS
jgi:hypothetical protein